MRLFSLIFDVIVFISLSASCSPEQWIIRQAKAHNMESPCSDAIHSYIKTHLAYPESALDIEEYVKEMLSFYGQDADDSILIARIDEGLARYVLKDDACYLYDRESGFGTVVQGNPEIWTREHFRGNELWWEYSPAFFSKDGKVLFAMLDYDHQGDFSTGHGDIRKCFKQYVLGKDDSFYTRRVLLSYTSHTGLVVMDDFVRPSRYPELYSVEDVENAVPEPLESFNFADDCSEYLQAVGQYCADYVESHPDVHEIRFVSALYLNER